jgi:hypothetical protein
MKGKQEALVNQLQINRSYCFSLKSICALSVSLLILLITAPSWTAEKTTRSSLENPFEYTKNLVESFAWAKSGLTRTDTAIKLPLNNTQAIADLMFQIKLADIDYNHALREIESFRQSKHEAIQLSSDAAYEAYRGLIDADNGLSDLMQKEYGALTARKTESIDSGESLGRMTDLRVAKNQSWKMLALVVAPAATHALVRMPEGKEERLSRLTVTGKERAELIRLWRKFLALR